MTRFLIPQRDARELTDALNSSISTPERTVRDGLTDDNLRGALANLADAKARKAVGSRAEKRIGLVSYSSLTNLEAERTALDAAAITLEAELRSYFTHHDKSQLLGGADFDGFLHTLTTTQEQVLTQGAGVLEASADPVAGTLSLVSDRTPQSRLLKRRFGFGAVKEYDVSGMDQLLKELHKTAVAEAAKYGVKRSVSGLITGALVQEGITDIIHWAKTGDFELMGGISRTLGFAGRESAAALGPLPVGEITQTHTTGSDFVQLSNSLYKMGDELVYVSPDGVQTTLSDHAGAVLRDLSDGTLSQETLNSLNEHARIDGLDLDFQTVTRQINLLPHPPLTEADYHMIDLDPTKSGEILTKAPKELMWVDTPSGERALVLWDINSTNPQGGPVTSWQVISTADTAHDVQVDINKHLNLLRFDHFESRDINAPVSVGMQQVQMGDVQSHPVSIDIPQGTKLLDRGNGLYDLVTDSGNPHEIDAGETLVRGLRINQNGMLTDDGIITRFGRQYRLDFEKPDLVNNIVIPGQPAETGYDLSQTINLKPNSYGGGFWELTQKSINLSDYAHPTAANNAIKNLAGAFNDNQLGSPFHDGDYPKIFFSDEGMSKIAKWSDKGIEEYLRQKAENPGWNNNQLMDAVMERNEKWGVALRLGYYGIPGAASDREIRILAEALGGTGTEGTPDVNIDIYHSRITAGNFEHKIGTDTIRVFGYNPQPFTEATVLTVYDRTIPGQLPIPIIPLGIPRVEAPVMTLPRTMDTAPGESPMYYGYGGYMLGLESWKNYTEWLKKIDRMPPIIPPETERSVSREQERIRKYLDAQPEAHRKAVERITYELPPMHPDARVAVMIPVYHEEKNIYHTLSEWAKQTDADGKPLNHNLYEINVLVNREEDLSDDGSLGEVDRFRRDNPGVRVNVAYTLFPKGQGGVGPARKLIADTLLNRSVRRGDTQTGQLYLESEDADLLSIDTKAVYNLISKFDANPGTDALRGKQDLAPEILKEHDYLFVERRVERFSEYLLRDKRLRPEVNPDADSRWNTVVLGGWNSAFTAESYAMIGGYQPIRIGEDVDIGSRISIMRGKANPDGSVTPNTMVIDTVRNIGQSNPRRFIYALETKRHAYHTFGDREIDQKVRDIDPAEFLRRMEYGNQITYENKALFESVLTENVRWIRDVVKNPELRDRLTGRLMLFLGFSKYRDVTGPDGQVTRKNGPLSGKAEEGWKPDYHIESDSKVVIDNIENIKNALENYRQRTSAEPETALSSEDAAAETEVAVVSESDRTPSA
ncbi:hypothetical protein A2Z33_02030 [Candidatus Gottesmanbacteria bacterium RBG_16_52_11]|uniref:Uncharacterized protein n=1 Tax=Candidatus Gottesmanbacteria bacterium RBG_16_52_11 TaxID=1798374 RepID=A0A1F5YQS3_9BACT|nr:MAG: hypothetical protein A2Z33_02030 [Candidatus Gottesmanbacteria bacterium RBG_16_52_11]